MTRGQMHRATPKLVGAFLILMLPCAHAQEVPDWALDIEQLDVGILTHQNPNVNEDIAPASTPTQSLNYAPKAPGPLHRLYGRLFNDGQTPLPKMRVTLYRPSTQGYQRVTDASEPFGNILLALKSSQEVALGHGAHERLQTLVQEAAAAVGYYDVNVRFSSPMPGALDVYIDHLDEGVTITQSQILLQGDGAKDSQFALAPKTQVGRILHHGTYEADKAHISQKATRLGYFDGQYLDQSATVILPDNEAEVSLIYDTGPRYRFGEVVFFTLDPATGALTDDPDALPVRPELLHRLLTFAPDEPFDGDKVTNFGHDLVGTRFFDQTKVEMVLPDNADEADAGVGFVNAMPSVDTALPNSDAPEILNPLLMPIDFVPNATAAAKKDAIKAKAQSLLLTPSDQIAPIETAASTSLLGRLADGISSLARRILPESQVPQPIPPLPKTHPSQVYTSKRVPLYVFVESKKPRDLQLGLGYGSDTRARMTFKFDHNLINKSGTQLQSALDISNIKKQAGISLTHPLTHPLKDTLSLSTRLVEETPKSASVDSKTQTLEMSLYRNQALDNVADGLAVRYGIRGRLDKLDVNADALPSLPAHFVNADTRQEAVLVGGFVDYNRLSPAALDGYRIQGGAEVGYAQDAAMGRITLQGGAMKSLGQNKRHQVIARAQGGYIFADDFHAVPYKLRFFAGGDQSIRGYNYDSISPTRNGLLTGGQSLATAGLEYNYEIKDGLRLAGFVDGGGAFDRRLHGDVKLGAGVGVRYATPVGTLQLDVATPIGEDDAPVRLHFFMGAPF